jgi:hypothetical protein
LPLPELLRRMTDLPPRSRRRPHACAARRCATSTSAARGQPSADWHWIYVPEQRLSRSTRERVLDRRCEHAPAGCFAICVEMADPRADTDADRARTTRRAAGGGRARLERRPTTSVFAAAEADRIRVRRVDPATTTEATQDGSDLRVPRSATRSPARAVRRRGPTYADGGPACSAGREVAALIVDGGAGRPRVLRGMTAP